MLKIDIVKQMGVQLKFSYFHGMVKTKILNRIKNPFVESLHVGQIDYVNLIPSCIACFRIFSASLVVNDNLASLF